MRLFTDVFPKEPTNQPLKKLKTYPDKYFNQWKYKPSTQIYVYFMNKHDRVYYMKKEADDKSNAAIRQIGKQCQKFDTYKFGPSHLDFDMIKNRLRKSPDEECRSNADLRLAFKLGNQYLVKTYFTSGLRTVKPGTAHVVQTLLVPLLMYVLPKKLKNHPLAAVQEKVFPSKSIHLYDLSILPPNTCNRIPPGTKYVLLSVQKTYFTFDLVSEDYVIPFRHRDPVAERITMLEGCGDYFDKPVETPYIEHVPLDEPGGGGEEEEENFLMEQQQPPQPQQFVFLQPLQQQQQQQDEPMQQRIVSPYFQQQDEQMQQFTTQQPNVFLSLQQQQQQQQQDEPIQFQLQPNVFLSLQQQQQQQDEPMQQQTRDGGDPPLLLLQQQQQDEQQSAAVTATERNVIHLSVDFAKNFQCLKESNRIDSEPQMKIIPPVHSYCYQKSPLDLSKTAAETEVITVDNVNDDDDAATTTAAATTTTTTNTTAAVEEENVTPEVVTMNNVDILQQATDELFKDFDEFMQELSQEPPVPSSFDYDLSELLYS